MAFFRSYEKLIGSTTFSHPMRQQSLFHGDIHWEQEAHVLSLRWSDFTPHLLCSATDDGRVMDLTFEESLEMEVSNEKSCIGSWNGPDHIPCPTSSRVGRFPRCDSCADEVIPDQRCIFEPRCLGDSCLVDGHHGERIGFCSRPHFVYLAFYSDRIKIGMTSLDRLRQRCIEQGADAYVPLVHTQNRFDARSREKELARTYSLRQSFSNQELLRMTTSTHDRSEMERNVRALLSAMGMAHDDLAGDLTFLEDYPLTLPLRSVPRETTTPGIHFGKKIGIKGRFLYYESSGLRALNVVDIPSRRICFNAASGV